MLQLREGTQFSSSNTSYKTVGLPRWLGGKESAYQCRKHKRCEFNPCVRKIPWRRAWQPTLVFLPGESPRREEPGRLQSME